jgi:hypothetical protein
VVTQRKLGRHHIKHNAFISVININIDKHLHRGNMAHNSDRLAWDSLASMLELRRTNPCQHDAYNLHALIQPSSREKLANFVDIFAQSIAEDAAQQRKQYPEEYEVPGGNEVIISDEATTKIESTVRRWHPESHWPDDDGEVDPETFKQPTSKELCPHTNESDICGCVLPYKERKMSAFQRPQVQNDCFKFDTENLESFRNLKVVQSLILHGEMDPVLRSCAYEECQLAKWWEHRECYCTQQTFGWRSICEHAIRMYIILNVLHQFPRNMGRRRISHRGLSQLGGLSAGGTIEHGYWGQKRVQGRDCQVLASGLSWY